MSAFFAVGGRMRSFKVYPTPKGGVKSPLYFPTLFSPSLTFFFLSARHIFSIPGLSTSSLPSALYLFLFLPFLLVCILFQGGLYVMESVQLISPRQEVKPSAVKLPLLDLCVLCIMYCVLCVCVCVLICQKTHRQTQTCK